MRFRFNFRREISIQIRPFVCVIICMLWIVCLFYWPIIGLTLTVVILPLSLWLFGEDPGNPLDNEISRNIYELFLSREDVNELRFQMILRKCKPERLFSELLEELRDGLEGGSESVDLKTIKTWISQLEELRELYKEEQATSAPR